MTQILKIAQIYTDRYKKTELSTIWRTLLRLHFSEVDTRIFTIFYKG
jgi:hypothetical protein